MLGWFWYVFCIGLGVFVGRRYEKTVVSDPDKNVNGNWIDYSKSHLTVAGMPVLKKTEEGQLEILDTFHISMKETEKKE